VKPVVGSSSSTAGKPPTVETVLLDAGGVLLDLDYAFVRRLLVARGCEVKEAEIARAEALARAEIHRRVAKGGRSRDAWRDYFHIILAHAKLPAEGHEEIIDTLWDGHHRFGLWTVPVPGAVETAREMKDRGYRLGVVSNAEGRVERDLISAGFDGIFEAVVDSHVVGVEKPDPEIFRIALERMAAQTETTVFVGDVPAVDIAGARAAGIAPVLLDRHDVYTDTDVPRLTSIESLPGWLDQKL
jgi:putative hydrolase of the HAD superfamily